MMEATMLKVFERIRDVRKNDLGMTQTEFGKTLGVSRSVIKNIELNALARPEQKDPLIKLICKEFGINEHWLRTGEGEKYKDIAEDEYTRAVTELGLKDPKAKQAILFYWKLSAEDKQLFWNFFERFIKSKPPI